MLPASLALDHQALVALCRRRGIRRLALFGSILRGEARPDSDVDILVEFELGRVPGLSFITIQEELSRLLGRKVDLNTPAFLSPHFRDRVVREAFSLYEAA
jgi:predicted nucleotidyltransferase